MTVTEMLALSNDQILALSDADVCYVLQMVDGLGLKDRMTNYQMLLHEFHEYCDSLEEGFN